MVKRVKRRIPKKVVDELIHMCEQESKYGEKSAAEIFRGYLGLMDKYAYYFFSKPWPKEYCFEDATTFTDEDRDFLSENGEDYGDRFVVMCLKKNIFLEGFLGVFGMFWTRQAHFKQFVRPELQPIVEVFKSFAEKDKNPRSVLSRLKERFVDVYAIHLSLVDLLDYEYPGKEDALLIAGILELTHTEEGLLPCNDYLCRNQIERLHEDEGKLPSDK